MKYLVLILMLMVSACSTTTIDTSVIEARLALTGDVVNDHMISVMTDEEVLIVIESMEMLDTLANKWSSEPLSEAQWHDFYSDYLILRDKYLIVYSIVQAHWDEYDGMTRNRLLMIHARFKEIGDNVKSLYGKAQMVNSTVTTGLLLVKLLAKA